MILLDTNVLSELMRPAPEPRVLRWLDSSPNEDDALHLAFAENQKSEYFITCDDEIVRKSGRVGLRLKVANPVKFVEDLNI